MSQTRPAFHKRHVARFGMASYWPKYAQPGLAHPRAESRPVLCPRQAAHSFLPDLTQLQPWGREKESGRSGLWLPFFSLVKHDQQRRVSAPARDAITTIAPSSVPARATAAATRLTKPQPEKASLAYDQSDIGNSGL
ncbi:MAG: hypothetical protein KatS3mg110_1796 [Pirellulaceae bacterium]|nr:MAG: hypothetical protein KatS3mg110_1796 [Pirellulaceae bacterium]